MVKNVYAVFDRKTNRVELIQAAINIDVFERWFVHVFSGSDCLFIQYPDDYDIYFLCSFDDETMDSEKSWKPCLITNVASILDHFRLARPDLARSSDEA